MALPHQAAVEITYEESYGQSVAGTAGNGQETYTVKSGDTLWAIAKKYYGSGVKYPQIYDANAEAIEASAKNHNKASSSNGHWIWPGQTLVLPGTGQENTVTTEVIKNPGLGEKITQQINSFSYTDVASGQSDSVSISMHDVAKEWIGSLMPKKGAGIDAKIRVTNWNNEERVDTFDCGSFILDDISFSGRPLKCTLGAVSVPVMEDFKSLARTQTWENTTVQNIASEICNRAGVTLAYDAPAIRIAELEQNKQTDSAFLYSLCEKYGLSMKVYKYKIVIFDTVAYEAKDAVITIDESEMLSGWSYNTTVDGTYTGVALNYKNPDSKDSLNIVIGNSGRLYSMNTQASSQYDAELQAAAKVNEANRKIETMTVLIRGDIRIVASQCINITGLGNADGKYYVDQVKHTVGSGYKMQLTLHKVQQPIGYRVSDQNSSVGNYTVKSGDTLWAIAKKYYGSGTEWKRIYDANQDQIKSEAKNHNKEDSSNGHWIWPGESLIIPEK